MTTISHSRILAALQLNTNDLIAANLSALTRVPSRTSGTAAGLIELRQAVHAGMPKTYPANFPKRILECDIVVIATNHHALSKWIPAEWIARDHRFARLDQLESVPILGAHLWFDRPVMNESHAALIEGPLQWIFRKIRAATRCMA